jgi:hypothetical protein
MARCPKKKDQLSSSRTRSRICCYDGEQGSGDPNRFDAWLRRVSSEQLWGLAGGLSDVRHLVCLTRGVRLASNEEAVAESDSRTLSIAY